MAAILYIGAGSYIQRIDLSTFTVTHTSDVMNNTVAEIAVDYDSNDGTRVYCITQSNLTYSFLKADLTGKVTGPSIGTTSRGIAVGTDYVYAYGNSGGNRCFKLNKTTLANTGYFALSGYSEDLEWYDNKLYTCNQDDRRLQGYNTPNGGTIGTQSYGSYSPYACRVRGELNAVAFGGHGTNGTVKLCNLADCSLIGTTADIGGYIYGLDFDETYIYKADNDNARIDVINKSTFVVDYSIPCGTAQPRDVCVVDNFIYVGFNGASFIKKFNKLTGQYIGLVNIAGSCWTMDVDITGTTYNITPSDTVIINDEIIKEIGKNNTNNLEQSDSIKFTVGKNINENLTLTDLIKFTYIILNYCSIDPRKRIREVICYLKDIYGIGKDTYHIEVIDEHDETHRIPIYLTEETKSDVLPSFPYIEFELVEAVNELQDIGGRTQKNKIRMTLNIYWTNMDNLNQAKFGKAITDKIYDIIRYNQNNIIGNTWNYLNSFINVKTDRMVVERKGLQVIYHRIMELDFMCYDNDDSEGCLNE